MRPQSPAVADLLSRPLASVRVGPPDTEPVRLQGRVTRLPGRDVDGRLRFRVEPGAVHVGVQFCAVPVPDFLAASPDPLRDDAPALLAHLRQGHREDLAAYLRARGRTETEWVDPQSIDRYGLTWWH